MCSVFRDVQTTGACEQGKCLLGLNAMICDVQSSEMFVINVYE